MWEKIKLINSAIFAFVLPFLRQMMSQAGPILAAAAVKAVAVVAENAYGASGTQKRELAFREIELELKKQGIRIGADVATSMVNAAIELAVVKSKGGQ